MILTVLLGLLAVLAWVRLWQIHRADVARFNATVEREMAEHDGYSATGHSAMYP